jgi:hypothetical protein
MSILSQFGGWSITGYTQSSTLTTSQTVAVPAGTKRVEALMCGGGSPNGFGGLQLYAIPLTGASYNVIVGAGVSNGVVGGETSISSNNTKYAAVGGYFASSSSVGWPPFNKSTLLWSALDNIAPVGAYAGLLSGTGTWYPLGAAAASQYASGQSGQCGYGGSRGANSTTGGGSGYGGGNGGNGGSAVVATNGTANGSGGNGTAGGGGGHGGQAFQAASGNGGNGGSLTGVSIWGLTGFAGGTGATGIGYNSSNYGGGGGGGGGGGMLGAGTNAPAAVANSTSLGGNGGNGGGGGGGGTAGPGTGGDGFVIFRFYY